MCRLVFFSLSLLFHIKHGVFITYSPSMNNRQFYIRSLWKILKLSNQGNKYGLYIFPFKMRKHYQDFQISGSDNSPPSLPLSAPEDRQWRCRSDIKLLFSLKRWYYLSCVFIFQTRIKFLNKFWKLLKVLQSMTLLLLG